MRLAETDHVIYISQSHVLFATTCGKQDVRLADADRMVCFSQSSGYYTLLLICLLRSTGFCLSHINVPDAQNNLPYQNFDNIYDKLDTITIVILKYHQYR